MTLDERGAQELTAPELIQASVKALGVQNAEPFTSGGQKWVLRATLASEPVVVKIVKLPPGLAATVVLERAHREVELLAAVDSSYVVKVLSEAVEVGPRPDAVAWVEEMLAGGDLTTALTPVWSDERIFALLHDLSHALKACHDLDVVHRDLSPGNIRELPDGHFVLMDPGYAKHLRLTAITGIYQPGTSGHRSPEHVANGSPSAASDIYCLGILAYVAATGVYPIDPTGTQQEYDRRLIHSSAPDISTLRPDMNQELAKVINKCLHRQVARRYLDGTELIAALGSSGLAR